ncbi:MAG: TetR/AcrR family transcriptional regulator [Saprospiraceae bacterium]|jgi:AcrR family transcriptional regulator|nr:TetR/AcrR family transcriptional regulator [Saprospiraceae bacterium]MBK6564352.1 TetR/AcrR family transcriptional regulator [Saprospiraceae bacterium]MBK6782519.1 TetR/AcrR family transcriptional regulator [Saprospiraceae bacterium]MBK7523966.1 TetR/AcrR family transcriptional regulator [Saprospiraceae bacterium]MBK8079067.1 TetR/AcrR family transcriptional regulator [Saprospiraceae bacterium]
MGSSERKEREKAELKELILDTSKRLLLKFGKHGLSVRKIAKEIEYSPATIYLHFKDKDEILHELMEMGFMLMNKYMVPAFAEKDPSKRIYEIGRAYIKFGLEQADWYDLMFNSDEPMKHVEKCREDWDEGMALFNFLTITCNEAIEKYSLKGYDAQIIALQLWSVVHGLVNLALTDRLGIVQPSDQKILIDKVLDSTIHCLFKK